jgi:membrane fusion protein (multidrug efflux system)
MTIYAVQPQVDASTRTLSIKAISENNDNALLPGQFTKIDLVFNSKEDALLVPTEAVIPELGGHKVYVNRAGKAESVNVRIGLRTESSVEIIEGLQASDTLITSGMLQLRPGADVSINILN